MFNLKVEPRVVKNQSNNSLRKAGMIPAVYYHKGEQSQSLKVSMVEIKKAMASHEAVIQLSNNKMVIIKEVQRNPVSSKIEHVSFQGVVAGEKFHKTVPVVCIHEPGCAWQKAGMLLSQTLNQVEIETTPENVPEHIVIDVSELDKGVHLRLKDITPPKGVKFTEDGDLSVAHVAYPHVEEPSTVETPVAGSATEASNDKKEA